MIRTTDEFNAVFADGIKIAMDYVMDKMLEQYQRDIMRIVYQAGTPTMYNRTFQFYNSWETKVYKKSLGALGELAQDYSKMTLNPLEFQHGSYFTSSGDFQVASDVRENLADIIFEGLSGNLFGDGYWRQSRDPWTPLLKKLDTKQLDMWFKTGLRRAGITNFK